MCPCISSRSDYATCNHHEAAVVHPSEFDRENYCFGIYELCPVFSAGNIQSIIRREMIEMGYETPTRV